MNRLIKAKKSTTKLLANTSMLLELDKVSVPFLCILFVSCSLFMFSGCNPSPPNDPHKTWRDYGGSPDMSRFVELDEINKSNVNQLKQTWFYPSNDERVYQFNPIIVDTVMYVLAKNNSLIALHAETGEEIWIHANLAGIARRGINYWESSDGKDKRLIFQMNNYLQAIDAETGKSILDFGENGLVNLKKGLGKDPEEITRIQSGTPGKIYKNLLLLGSAPGESYLSNPGHVRAYNVISGELEWVFHTIPQPGEFGYDTWPKDAYKYVGGINTWGEISVDEERGIAYFPLGSPTYDYYGADRKGKNLFGNSIVALNAETGERLWHYQMVHHDLWDYDPSSAPQLITVQHEGKSVDAVAVVPKHGFIFVFDRVTGEPLWPIEERPVPQSDVPGEEAWPTQPYPTAPPPASRLSMTSEDISPYLLSKEERQSWKERIDKMQKGLFTPLSHEHETLVFPGAVGGVGWGNTASNPEEGMLYVLTMSWPSFFEPMTKIELSEEPEEEIIEQPKEDSQTIFAQFCSACHGQDGSGLIGPDITNMEEKLNFTEFEQVMVSGRGEMPAFPQYDEEQLKELYTYLSSNSKIEVPDNSQELTLPEGPVVASGGAPGGLSVRRGRGWRRMDAPYPNGVDAPSVRYITQGWGLSNAYVISPPWSSIVAYDLNEGVIKWKKPIGQDRHVLEEGGENSGVPQAQRNGMIVTSTGIVFSTAKDGKIYAFDAETGDILWSGNLPTGTEGMPAMYEVNGRHYLVVTAATPIEWGRDLAERGISDEAQNVERGYVVFSLPD